MRLHEINLNLLLALDALLDERSVTRAASRLNVSQPAMSHSLRQLRDILDDPILVRGSAGMHLTPRADGMVAPLRSHLRSLEVLLDAPGDFEPSTSKREFRVAAPDLLAGLVTPVLMRLCGQEAPGVTLAIEILTPQWETARLESGDVDLALGSGVAPFPGDQREIVYEDEYACLARVGHPNADTRVSLYAFTKFPHVVLTSTPVNNREIDEALARRGHERKIALEIPYQLIAPLVVLYTDLLYVGPRLVCELSAVGLPLNVHHPPLALPGLAEELVWHDRLSADPAHRWLRGMIHRTIDEVRTGAATQPWR